MTPAAARAVSAILVPHKKTALEARFFFKIPVA